MFARLAHIAISVGLVWSPPTSLTSSAPPWRPWLLFWWIIFNPSTLKKCKIKQQTFSDHVFHSGRGILCPNVCCRHAGQVPPTYICRKFSRNSLSTFSERFSWCSAAAAWAWLRLPLPAYFGPPPTLRRYYLAAISSIKCSEAAS